MPKRFWATWPITRFVLSPSVETTTASASSMPASRRMALSMPWPRTKPPVQFSPRRLRADSFSSTAVTSHPSEANRLAIVEPTRPQPMTMSFIALSVARRSTPRLLGVPSEGPLWEGDDQYLARRLLQDVVDSEREHAGLPAPAGGRPEHDQVGALI